MIKITQEPILPEVIINKVKKDACGAVVTFVGMVRDYSGDDKVVSLEFKASEEAPRKLRQLVDEVKARWQSLDIAICHRVGKLKAGEIIVVIAVAAPHRKEAFEVCQYAIERAKEIVSKQKEELL